MPAELKQAEAGDAQAIFAMQTEMATRTYRPMDLESIAGAIENDVTYLIMSNGEVVGFLIYKKKGGHVLLDEFGVKESQRGKGIGTSALKAFFAELEGRPVELTTHPENPAAHLYHRCGFVKLKVIDNFYGDGEPRMLMRREVRTW